VDYDRYLWLVKRIEKAGRDESRIYRFYPFLIKEALFSSMSAPSVSL
jgi:hypothetical protein